MRKNALKTAGFNALNPPSQHCFSSINNLCHVGLSFPLVSEYFLTGAASHTGHSSDTGLCELSQGMHIKRSRGLRAGFFEECLFTRKKEEDELGKETRTPGTADACAHPIIDILPFP